MEDQAQYLGEARSCRDYEYTYYGRHEAAELLRREGRTYLPPRKRDPHKDGFFYGELYQDRELW